MTAPCANCAFIGGASLCDCDGSLAAGDAGESAEFAAAARLLRERGAEGMPHSGRTLYEHLVGTCRLLRSSAASEPVCLAGLCHSVYGTNAFRHALIDRGDRAAVRAAIGIRAEALVWAFCTIDRPRALAEGDRSVPAGLRSDLVAIEIANLTEQGGSRWLDRLAAAR